MTVFGAYRDQRGVGWTRIDLLLALYDGVIERLQEAREALSRNDAARARLVLLRVQRIVAELAAGLDLQRGDLPLKLQQLYAFVLRCLAGERAQDLEAAERLLSTLRDSWRAIRAEAVDLERRGAIPPVDSVALVRATV